VGCGDGSYTVELHDRGRPSVLHGIDPASAAIAAARQRAGGRAIEFRVGSAYDLPYGADGFDIAYLRGVLHHLERPVDALCEALRVAKRIVVVEPNGYSPILKLLERASRYHRAHGEKSYPPHRLRQWVEDLGGEITAGHFAGLVPMFAPDPLARLAKAIEPLVEATPLLRCVGCAVYVFAATRREGKAAGKAVA
jgi:ubiquinone/menaquinone biosynthesis C-methylase UbiE